MGESLWVFQSQRRHPWRYHILKNVVFFQQEQDADSQEDKDGDVLDTNTLHTATDVVHEDNLDNILDPDEFISDSNILEFLLSPEFVQSHD